MERSEVWVRFYNDAVEDKAASRTEKRPIYRDVEMAEIRYPGDRNRVLVVPAHEYTKTRDGKRTWAEMYPAHYSAFKRNAEQTEKGTPLAELPFLTEARRKELKAANIHTAESLAGLDPTAARRLGMGYVSLSQDARAYLKNSDAAADAREKEDMRAEIRQLREQMMEMARRSQSADDAAPRMAPVEDDEPMTPEEMSDAELRAAVEDETGKAAGSRASRETLMQRLREARGEVEPEDA